MRPQMPTLTPRCTFQSTYRSFACSATRVQHTVCPQKSTAVAVGQGRNHVALRHSRQGQPAGDWRGRDIDIDEAFTYWAADIRRRFMQYADCINASGPGGIYAVSKVLCAHLLRERELTTAV